MHCRTALAILALLAPACANRTHVDESAHAATVFVPRITADPPPPRPPSPRAPLVESFLPVESPTCVLTANDIELAHPMPLRLGESTIFYRLRAATTLEVRITHELLSVEASRPDLDVVGNVRHSDVALRLRSDALVDGYLRVRSAGMNEIYPDHIMIDIGLPYVKPVKWPARRFKCDELAIASKAVRAETVRGKAIDLRVGVPLDLRATPGGPVVATLALPAPGPNVLGPVENIYELERRSAEVRIRLENDRTDVEGWVSARDVLPHVGAAIGVPDAVEGDGPKVSLADAVPLLVHMKTYSRTATTPSTRVVRVGTARPATFACVKPWSGDPRGIEISPETPFFPIPPPRFESGRDTMIQSFTSLFVMPTRGARCKGAAKPAPP